MAYQTKNYSKFVATAATATLVASAVAPLASAAQADKFTDVNSSYKEAVEFVVSKGANGLSETQFGVSKNIIRQDAAVLLVKVLGLDVDLSEKKSDFTDIPSHVAPYINALKKAGITSGKTTTKFGASDKITRGELAIWIQKGFKLEAKEDTKTFSDVNERYQDAVAALVANKVTSGVGNGDKFGTTQNATRGQYAIFLFKASQATNPIAPLATVETVKAENGKVVVTLDKELEAVKAEDFKVSQTINGEQAKAVTPTDVKLGENKKIVEITVPTVTENEKEQSVVVSVAYKTGTAKAAEAFKVAAVTPAVTSVAATSATQVQVKFNSAVDPKSVFADGKKGNFKSGTTVSFGTLNAMPSGALTGELSEDGKTLTITSANTLSKRYDVVINGFKTVSDKAVVKYEQMLTFDEDTKAPTITGTEQISATQVKIKFSEPVKAFSNATFKYSDGTAVNGVSLSIPEGATEAVVDLKDTSILINKPIKVTFIGLQDKAGNLVTPNPTTVEITKQQADGVKPTVSAITQSGVRTFNVSFSKEVVLPTTAGVINKSAVTISNYAVTSIDKVSNSEYKVTVDKNLTGVQNVTVAAGYADSSNQAGEAVTKVVSFTTDTAAPKVTSSKVVVGSNNAEYLELAFDKEVTEGNVTISGTYTKDYVTNTLSSTNVAAIYANDNSKKELRIPLSQFANEKGASYKVDVTSASVNGVKSLAGVALEKTSTTFTRNGDGAENNTNKLAAPVLAVVDNNTLIATFTGEVDGASATNTANYNVDGAAIDSVTLASYDKQKNTQAVTIKLRKNSNGFTGVRNITVENVKALGSTVTMDKFTKNDLSLNENVNPTVEKAELTTTNTITLTFSEAVSNSDNTAGQDFELWIGGTKASNAKVETAVVAKGAEKDTLVATISGYALTDADLKAGLQLKATNTINIVDAVNNAADVNQIIVK